MGSRRATGPIPPDPYIPRSQALAILGIKPQTLYAYVSRGWIRSVRKPGGGKVSLYAREDVDNVRARSTARMGHGVAAAGAMRWGEPIIPTAITEITAQGPRYRGRGAVDLARSGASFESVAELLWSGMLFEETLRWRVAKVPKELVPFTRLMSSFDPDEHLIDTFALVTLHLGMSRGTVPERIGTASPSEAARQLIQMLVGCMGLLGPTRSFEPMDEGESISGALLRVLGAAPTADNRRSMESILVLLADHELTSSTFAARVAASAGALLHECVAAAIATNSGLEMGRLYHRIEAWLMPSGNAGQMLQRVGNIQEQGGSPSGFNHPIYPKGDPRADYLLSLASSHSRKPQKLKNLLEFLEQGRVRMLLHPRVEMGVIAACQAMRLPTRAPGGLFTIARTAGWVAHVLEQRTAGFLLRPRARFVARAESPAQ